MADNLSDNETNYNSTINVSVEINETVDLNETNITLEPEIVPEETSLINTFLELLLNKLTLFKGDILEIDAVLFGENDTPLSNQAINFYKDGEEIGSSDTDDAGLAEFDLDTSNLEPGVYIIGVDFDGDEIYDDSYASQSFRIKETEEEQATPNEQEEIVNDIEEIKSCEVVSYKEEKVYEDCQKERIVDVCNEDNTSCEPQTETYNSKCLLRVDSVPQEKCKVEGYKIKNKFSLDTKDYGCSTEKDGNDVIMICDSIYDGNGDGVCDSGESCVKFIIGNEAREYFKNSGEEFLEEDDSFFLEKIGVEVEE